MKRENLQTWLIENGFNFMSKNMAQRNFERVIMKPQSFAVKNMHHSTKLWFSVDGSRYANATIIENNVTGKNGRLMIEGLE